MTNEQRADALLKVARATQNYWRVPVGISRRVMALDCATNVILSTSFAIPSVAWPDIWASVALSEACFHLGYELEDDK